jgi:hypothetical protein
MTMKVMRRVQVRTAVVSLCMLNMFAATGGRAAETLKLVAKSPVDANASYIEATQTLLRDATHTVMIFDTLGTGAYCGGGSDVEMWRADLDPKLPIAKRVKFIQALSGNQTTRGTIFRSGSHGALFAGGGWCGPKPPFYSPSSDNGKTWIAAQNGVHPPNSTFSFGEFRGRVYAGTGYAPYNGEVYRWLGANGTNMFERVLSIPQPRTIVTAISAYENAMFVGSVLYGDRNCSTGAPVYRSSDGNKFATTKGIPACANVFAFAPQDGAFLSVVSLTGVYANYNFPLLLYSWKSGNKIWQGSGTSNFTLTASENTKAPFANGPVYFITNDGRYVYAFGYPTGVQSSGIYRSKDAGRKWELFAAAPAGQLLSFISIQSCELFAGTFADSTGAASMYQVHVEGCQAPNSAAGPGTATRALTDSLVR